MAATIDHLPIQPRLRVVPPDELTGPQHVGHAVNAALAKINATQHPNVVKMHDAIDGWIKEATSRGGEAGLEYIALCQARMESNLRNLSAWCADKAPLRPGMEGLTVWDISEGQHRLTKAAARIEGRAG